MSIAPPKSSEPVIAPHAPDPSADAFRLRYAHQMAQLRERLGVPNAAEIYTPNLERLASRPRLSFGVLDRPDLAGRAADPRFDAIVAHVHKFTIEAADLLPPDSVVMDAHDPNRAFADSLAWMATSILIDTDADRRARTMTGLLRWVRALREWGPFENNLPLAQSTIGLCLVYDWLFDELPPEERAALRLQIITQARFSLEENRGGLTMWRGQRFGANHNWAHHSARAFAALTLWGDDDAPLAPGELKFWLDDAMEDFWIVGHTHTTDGAPLEGPGYQDYGLRFFLDFAENAERLLHLRETYFNAHVRELYVRLFLMLPGKRGFMVIADGFPSNWGTFAGFNFRRLATRFRDPRLQLVGECLEHTLGNKTPFNWRDLFVFEPDLPAAPLDSMPLAHDMPDFGLFTARSDWGPDATFLGLRCGTASGETVVRTFGTDFGEAHAYPNQGNITFYAGSHEVLPGCNYAKTKHTHDHNLVVFAGRDTQAGRLVGQLGEGGGWFNGLAPTDPDCDYEQRDRPARLLAVEHGPEFHHYLCDLGGLYRLADDRVPGGFFFPDYHRSVVFLPTGSVVIVDRVRCPVPRTAHFRLLTAGENLTTDERGFSFHLGATPGRIDDFSPTPLIRSASIEETAAYETPPRAVATCRATDTTEAIFAVVLSVGPAMDRHRIVTDPRGYRLRDAADISILRVDWPPTDAV